MLGNNLQPYREDIKFPRTRKNLPLQKKGLSKIKKTGPGIKIGAKKKPMQIKRK